MSKIIKREEVAAQIEYWKSLDPDIKIGYTSGTFDILTAGHVDYLEKAKGLCDRLIVGLNSDVSVKAYKGPTRPIIPQNQRAKVLAGLGCVDTVFLFDETGNRANLEAIRPNFYIKGGDYKASDLKSRDVLEKFEGEVRIIPMTEDVSVTRILETIQASEEWPAPNSQKAILIDRDGTINVDTEYLHEPEKFQLLPNAGEGLRSFQDQGYKIVVITCQAGIGLGYYAKEDMYRVHREMFKQLKPYGVVINKIYFSTSPRTPDGMNAKIGLIDRARDELGLDLSKCVAIGDKTGDLAAAPFSIQIGVKTGGALSDKLYYAQPDYMADDLLDAANFLNLRKK